MDQSDDDNEVVMDIEDGAKNGDANGESANQDVKMEQDDKKEE